MHLFVGSQDATGFFWYASLAETSNFPWGAIFTTNRHAHIESALEQQNRPFQIVNAHEEVHNGTLPLYKFYGTKPGDSEAVNGVLHQPDHKIVERMCAVLQNGDSLLLLCATESEMMMVFGACQNQAYNGQLWLAGDQLPEDKQDNYRSVGFRVIPNTPDEILFAITEMRVSNE